MMNILVVEDNDFSRKLIVRLLEKDEFIVEAKESAVKALEFLESGEPCDLIITDVMMPHMDGFALLQRIKTNKRINRIPVILCTALGDKKSIIKGIEAGIAGYVVKPIKGDILIGKIKEAIEKRPGSVLVVDDEEVIRGIVERVLSSNGYPVVTAETGEEAMKLIKTTKINLVLSDIQMPLMDGFDLLSKIKSFNMEIPVILMSGRNKNTRDEIVAIGANSFIAKPFYNYEILEQVSKFYK